MDADEEEVLRRLEHRLDQASETAQRLMAEAAQAAEHQRAAARAEQERVDGKDSGQGRVKPPPAGWQTTENGRAGGTPGAELDALIGAVRSLRELVPPEVMTRLAEAVKDILLAIRALLDWYIERLERRRTEPPPVEDIPIE